MARVRWRTNWIVQVAALFVGEALRVSIELPDLVVLLGY
jgi:hypothetical protein